MEEKQNKGESEARNEVEINKKLQIENFELELTKKIITKTILQFQLIRKNKLNFRDKYELMNCIERFLLSMANTPAKKEYNLFHIYRILDSNNRFLKKYINELIEKKLISEDYKIIKSYILLILSLINNSIKNFKFTDEVSNYGIKNEMIFYSDEFYFKLVRNLKFLIDKNQKDLPNILQIAMRYCALITGGQHWGITSEYYEYLYKTCNVKNEGFASILNTKAIYYDDCHFCSLFPDIEEKYGSLGSFFDVEMENYGGNWTVNPPFTELIIFKTIKKVIEQIKKSKKEIFVFIFIPYWTSIIEKSEILKNEYMKGFIILNGGDMNVESLKGFQIPIKNKHIQIMCTNSTNKDKIALFLVNMAQIKTKKREISNFNSKEKNDEIDRNKNILENFLITDIKNKDGTKSLVI
jgi:hypothetical protein